jgi:mannose-6-phosphate isomerase-like protein (cupin superfamily)
MTRFMLVPALAVSFAALPAARQAPAAPAAPAALAQRIVHTDPARFRPSTKVHDGAGELDFTALLNAGAFDTNQNFLHRGVIQPKSGIGVHFHNQCEEMFFILDGEAQFTIDGRTSLIKGPAGVPTRMGHSHALYNATDKPVQWMNVNVTMIRGIYDAFNLGDTREGAPLDPIPNFMAARFDPAMLMAMNPAGVAKGVVRVRRTLGPSVFLTPWAYVDHVLLEPGAATTKAALADLGETFYVLNGSGTVTAGNETAPIGQGDALPIRMGEAKAFENTGTGPLEMIVIGVARDMDAKNAFMAMPGSARGAAGGGRAGGARGGARGAGAGRGAGRGN